MAIPRGLFRRTLPLSRDHARPGGILALKPSRAALAAGFATLYFVWGSTYLAIRIAVASIPPFTLSGLRFVAAGATLLLWRRLRGGIPFPSPRQWLGAASVGICLVTLSNVSVVTAEQTLPSGVVALFASGTPLLIALLNRRRTGTPLGRRRGIGLALGTVGMVLLAGAMFSAVHRVTPILLMALASCAWATGSTYGRGWGSPPDLLMASAAQMLVGGAMALVAAHLANDVAVIHANGIPLRSLVAWGYLAVFGSLLAYPVFQWLLSVADPTAVVSYTYVNPIVALLLGTFLGHEVLSLRTMLATMVLIPAVVLVVTGESRKEAAAPAEE
ncbi:MAG: EamA family transporter [Gemmatimonadales bacterium]